MPLLHYYTLEHHTRLGVWNIEENEQYFFDKLELSDSEWNYITGKYSNDHRRLEWLAGQYLLHVLTGYVAKPERDMYGKPILSNSNWHLSISHSHFRTASIISNRINGIDIQLINEKILKLYTKFVNDDEAKYLNDKDLMQHVSVIWGAKEALYKAYSKREIDFKKNLIVHKFDLNFENGWTTGSVIKEDIHMDFNIYYKKLENYILVYAIEK
jgi:4'-phosphopantetheinyl transferase